MRTLINPVTLRMALLLFTALASFGFGMYVIRRLRKHLAREAESVSHAPLAAEGLPVHAYHAVIQQLKQQKHELAAQRLAERRRAKASDTLSSTVLANLSSGVLFVNTAGLVRQANAAARDMLGFASPVGLHVDDLFRAATPRASNTGVAPASSVAQVLAPALSGKGSVRGLLLNCVTREGESRVLEVTASPVTNEDASVMGTTLVLNDKTDIERLRHEQRLRQEVSAELAQELRNSLATIAGYAQQLACGDQERARQLANAIAAEAVQFDRTLNSFLADAPAAVAGM